MRDLAEVFTILKRHKLRLKAAKCAFGGKLKKVLWAFGNIIRDRGESIAYCSYQQPCQIEDCEGGLETNRNGNNI